MPRRRPAPLAVGTAAWGCLVVPQGSVLYRANEGGQRSFRARMEQILGGEGGRRTSASPTRPSPWVRAWRRHWTGGSPSTPMPALSSLTPTRWWLRNGRPVRCRAPGWEPRVSGPAQLTEQGRLAQTTLVVNERDTVLVLRRLESGDEPLGLLGSDEPGCCWHFLDGGQRCLRRTRTRKTSREKGEKPAAT